MDSRHGRSRGLWALLGAGLVLAAACSGGGGNNEATTTLSGANEVPPVNTPATGTATATLEGNTLSVQGSFSGLQSNLLAVGGSPAHVHQADAGANGPVIFGLTVDAGTDMRSGSFIGNGTLTEAQRTAFLNGQMYINVHTADAGAGEIRGQLIPE